MAVAALAIDFDVTDEQLAVLSDEFETQPPDAVLRWAFAEFGPDVALATGFGAEGCVLIHMVSRITKGARIFYLDTDLLFPETYTLRDQLAARYDLRFERVATRLSLSAQAAGVERPRRSAVFTNSLSPNSNKGQNEDETDPAPWGRTG